MNIDEVKLAALTFGNHAYARFDFSNGFTTKEQYYQEINNLNYEGGFTNTTGGLWMARTMFFNPANGDHPNASNLMLVLTDGNVTREAGSFEQNRISDMNGFSKTHYYIDKIGVIVVRI